MTRARRTLPASLWIPAGLAGVFVLVPLVGLVVGAPWGSLLDEFRRPAVLDALWLSLVSSFAAAGLSCVLGLPLALWLAEEPHWTRTLVRALVTLPLVLPPIVAGVALLLVFGRNGWLGAPLEAAFGVTLPFSTLGVVLAATFVALPFFVLAAESGLRAIDVRYLDAAATLGASPWRVLRTVTLPLVAPALRAGLVLAWARALGEFGATITFAGNLAGETRTLPLAVFVALETEPDAAIALSLLLLALSGSVLFLLRHRWFPSR